MFIRIEKNGNGGEAAIIAAAADNSRARQVHEPTITITLIGGGQKESLLEALEVLGPIGGYQDGPSIERLRNAARSSRRIIIVAREREVICLDSKSGYFKRVEQIYNDLISAQEAKTAAVMKVHRNLSDLQDDRKAR